MSIGAVAQWVTLALILINPVMFGEVVLTTILGVIYLVLRLFGLA